MNLNYAHLQTLEYDKIKVMIWLRPIVKTGKLTFKLETKVDPNYAFLESDDKKFFVPCLIAKQQVAKSVFADTYVFEQVRKPGDYGTYQKVPKTIPVNMTHIFFEVPNSYPIFEGFFTTIYDVRRGWRVLQKQLIEQILPLHCVKDPELVDAINKWDIENYYLPEELEPVENNHTYSFDFGDDDGK